MYLLIILIGFLVLTCGALVYYIYYISNYTTINSDKQNEINNKRNDLLKIIYDPIKTTKSI